MNPAEGIRFFGAALVIGAVLGLCYGLLRPFRPRWLGDFIFVCLAFYGFLYLSFAVCRGDIRLGYTFGLLIGGIAFDCTLGRVIRKPIACIYRFIFENFFKKPIGFFKNLLAKRKKQSKI